MALQDKATITLLFEDDRNREHGNRCELPHIDQKAPGKRLERRQSEYSAENELSLERGFRLLSAYKHPGGCKIWIIRGGQKRDNDPTARGVLTWRIVFLHIAT